MDASLIGFAEDLKVLALYQDNLPVESFYIAGCCRTASGADINQILLLMVEVEEAVILEKLTEDQKRLILYSLFQGRFNEATRMLRDLTEVPIPQPLPQPKKKTKALVRFKAEQEIAFTQSVEIGGRTFARNPYTGEITTPQDAESLEQNLKELSARLDQEEEKKSLEDEKRDEELARKLQSEFESGVQISEEPQTTCQICLAAVPESDLLPLDTCGHIFHPDCIKEYLELNINESKFPLVCPLRTCQVEVSILDIRERLSEETIEKFEQFSFNYYVGMNKSSLFSCPTPNCRYVCQFSCEEQFICPVCTKHYCLKCQVEYHDGLTCEQYRKVNSHLEEDDLFMHMAKGARFKQCPNCKFWVEKTEGCDHMVCRCGFQWCYACGGVYMACECMANQPQRRMRPMRIMDARGPQRMRVAPPQRGRPGKRGGVVPRRRGWK